MPVCKERMSYIQHVTYLYYASIKINVARIHPLQFNHCKHTFRCCFRISFAIDDSSHSEPCSPDRQCTLLHSCSKDKVTKQKLLRV